jgi:hypothetical protein
LECRENAAFEIFHPGCRAGLLMVVTEQVQNAVRDQVADMIGEGFVLRRGFARYGLEREHDIA